MIIIIVGSDFGALKDVHMNTAPRRLGLGIDVVGAASPLFSEDFGPASLPSSPLNISHEPLRYQQNHYSNINSNTNATTFQKLTIETSARNSNDNDNDNDNDNLAIENERYHHHHHHHHHHNHHFYYHYYHHHHQTEGRYSGDAYGRRDPTKPNLG